MAHPSPEHSWFQFCARCHARFPVVTAPDDWCAKCGGALLSPSTRDTPPEQRNFRWVARSPVPRQRRRPNLPTPEQQAEPPNWGSEQELRAAARPSQDQIRRIGEYANLLVRVAMIGFAVAAGAEIVRYALLVFNRERLVWSWAVTLSDFLVWVTGYFSVIAGVCAIVACGAWFVGFRERHFQGRHQIDPRPAWTILVGTLLPVVNLVMPGVFLTEVTRDSPPQLRTRVRRWWLVWIGGTALLVVTLWWRTQHGLQALANDVWLHAASDIVACVVAVLTLRLLAVLEAPLASNSGNLPVTPPVLPEKEAISR